ncbi:MAG: aldehyde dehydrogenase family protein, partial [Desulfobacterales bacterium]|nr:aldehyde dehydrogenase family protein [Desulfobacterales bacterium]
MTEFTRVRNYINGEWAEETGCEYVPLFNPSTGEEIGEVPLSSNETSLSAVAAASAASDTWRNVSLGKRMDHLFAMRQAVVQDQEELAVSIA